MTRTVLLLVVIAAVLLAGCAGQNNQKSDRFKKITGQSIQNYCYENGNETDRDVIFINNTGNATIEYSLSLSTKYTMPDYPDHFNETINGSVAPGGTDVIDILDADSVAKYEDHVLNGYYDLDLRIKPEDYRHLEEVYIQYSLSSEGMIITTSEHGTGTNGIDCYRVDSPS